MKQKITSFLIFLDKMQFCDTLCLETLDWFCAATYNCLYFTTGIAICHKIMSVTLSNG